ncbi:CMP-sialic acid transporter 1-like [Tropilaelaps mercedesae]|uniref:CMP-sialic acid transporter 1-like n=1 Tax=Tropilaelaps mercedesae TaxID=418985 RepID=A0A1V9XKN4_9ACAR|nr:CMP-sialic acid transporter 1-like [Tropilaelaps mercedesae]
MAIDRKFLGDIFPTQISALIFIGYIVFFIAQSILVKASQTNHHYAYNVTCVVMLTELLKLLLSTALYLKDHTILVLAGEIAKFRRVLGLYFVPALLYCFYNNLAFHNLQAFDPTTYNLLMQFRVVITGVVFQILFKRRLSGHQWFSLCLLTIGCIIKQCSIQTPETTTSSSSTAATSSPPVATRNGDSDQSLGMDGGGGGDGEGGTLSMAFSWNLVLLLFQMLCSCLAGVYNEFLLKDTGADLHIMVHNVFMYVDSIVCNLVVLLCTGQADQLVNLAALRNIFGQPLVMAIIVNGSLCGIIVSVFLRNLNSILKTFAGALDLAFTAVLCWIIFSIPIDLPTIMAITVVSIATYLYSKNPVVNKPKDTGERASGKELAEDKEVLLQTV